MKAGGLYFNQRGGSNNFLCAFGRLATNKIIKGQIINIDDKCLRGSDDKRTATTAVYMVSAWAAKNEIVLGQRKVGEKSNEITAIPELLKLLALSGCIVTIDAMGTQTNIAKTIIAADADYILSVKENQGRLYEDIETLFAVNRAQNFQYASLDYAKTVNKGHGRIETRECWTTSNPEYLNLIRGAQNWARLQSIAMVIGARRIGEEETTETRFYVSIDIKINIWNLNQPKRLVLRIFSVEDFQNHYLNLYSLPSNAQKILDAVRKHWSIKNKLHWVLDVAMNEDRCRVRKDQALENFAVLRHIALNLLKRKKTAKGGLQAKQLQAAWDEDYLMKVIATGI